MKPKTSSVWLLFLTINLQFFGSLLGGIHTWTGWEDSNWSNPNNWVEGAPVPGEAGVRLSFPPTAATLDTQVDVPGLTIDSIEVIGDSSTQVELHFRGEGFALSSGVTARRLVSGSRIVFHNPLSLVAPNRWELSGLATLDVSGPLTGTELLEFRGIGFGSVLALTTEDKEFSGRIAVSMGTLRVTTDAPQMEATLTTRASFEAPEAPPRVETLTFLGEGEGFYLLIREGLVVGNLHLAPAVYWEPRLAGVRPGTDYPQIVVLHQATLNSFQLSPQIGYEASNGDAVTLIRSAGIRPLAGRASRVEQGSIVCCTTWIADYHAGAGNDFRLTAVDRKDPVIEASISLYPLRLQAAVSERIELQTVVRIPGRGQPDGIITIQEGPLVRDIKGLVFSNSEIFFSDPGEHVLQAVFRSSDQRYSATSAPVVLTITNGPSFSAHELPRWAPNSPWPPTPRGRGITSLCAGPDRAWFVGDFASVNSEPEQLHFGWITRDGRIGYTAIPNSESDVGGVVAGMVRSPDGSMWFAQLWGNHFWRVSPSGKSSRITLSPPGAISTVTAGPDGTPWFIRGELGTTNAYLVHLNPDDSMKEFRFPTQLTVPAFGYGATPLTKGPDGALWFTTQRNLLGRVSTNGEFTLIPMPPQFSGKHASKMVQAGDGTLWMDPGGATLLGYDTNRMWHVVAIPSLLAVGATITDLTVSDAGKVWFTSSRFNQIGCLLPHDVIQMYFAPENAGVIGAGPDGVLYNASGHHLDVIETRPGSPAKGYAFLRMIASDPPAIRSTVESLKFTVGAPTIAQEVPTGWMTFLDRYSDAHRVRLDQGTASAVVVADGFPLRAWYSGDDRYHGGRLAMPFVDWVSPSPGDTTMEARFVSGPAVAGQDIRIFAQPIRFTGPNESRDGLIVVEEDSVPVGSTNIVPSEISLKVDEPGVHHFQVRYAGNEHFDPCVSGLLEVEVVSANSLDATVELVGMQVSGSRDIMLTGHIGRERGRPGGVMHFFESESLVGTAIVERGIATLRIKGVTPGLHRFTATYSGDRSFRPGQSDPAQVEVVAPPGPIPRLEVLVKEGGLEFLWNNTSIPLDFQSSPDPLLGPWETVDSVSTMVGNQTVIRTARPAANRFFRLIAR